MITSRFDPGTTTVSDKDYEFCFPKAWPGPVIPAGEVTVRAGPIVAIQQHSSMGNDSVSVNGVVASTSVNPDPCFG